MHVKTVGGQTVGGQLAKAFRPEALSANKAGNLIIQTYKSCSGNVIGTTDIYRNYIGATEELKVKKIYNCLFFTCYCSINYVE